MHVDSLVSRHVSAEGAPRKLLVVLHGRGDSPAGFAWLPKALGLRAFTYLFLQAPDPYHGGYSWYELPPDQGPGILRSRAALFATLDEVRAQGWESSDVILFGFSQGCLMSLDVGLRYPHPLGGVIGVSGYLFFEERVEAEAVPAAFEMPWLLTHGTHDDVLPIERTRAHARLLQAAGLPLEWREFPKAHTIDPAFELSLYRDWLTQRLADA